MKVELPQGDTPGELAKAYFTLMRAFGWDLYITCHFRLKDELGTNWFAGRISALKESEPRYWAPNRVFEPQDPAVILRDYVYEWDSPYLKVFGTEPLKKSAARKILSARNTWFHFGTDPTLAELGEVARTIRVFVNSTGLAMRKPVDALIARVDALATGKYPPATTVPTAEPIAPAEVETIPTPDDLPRPPIGGTWVGSIPDERYRITKTGDIVHPETLESVRSRTTGDYSQKLRAWTAVEPRGREVWIDDDGAIGGFIGATPRLLGYLGPDPEGEIARGFFTPHFYLLDGDEVVDIDTGERRAVDFATQVESRSSLRVTTYGDVVALGDDGGMERVATVDPGDWFPGHLS